MEICREWAIEVDKDRESYNLRAQEDFIVEFIGSLYDDINESDSTLSKIQSLHFTRIFHRDRDDMGAYVRLRVFADEKEFSDIDQEIDNRLDVSVQKGTIFQTKKNDLNWDKVAENYGGREVASLFRDYLDSISRISYQLLCKKQEGFNVEKVIWPWTHFFFNAIRGHGRSVLELTQGAVTGFWPNV